MLSLRIDGELLERLRHHAAKRGMSVQDYVVRTLIRDDFDERFQAAVEETENVLRGHVRPRAASGSRRRRRETMYIGTGILPAPSGGQAPAR
ncbi:hypothetical protein GCM10017687_49580 [Streptomyces echinatus]